MILVHLEDSGWYEELKKQWSEWTRVGGRHRHYSFGKYRMYSCESILETIYASEKPDHLEPISHLDCC